VEIGRQDGHLLVLLVDVTGHGHSAAQTVELLEHHLLVDPVCWGLHPADLLTRLNGMLQAEFAFTGRFVTAVVLLVEGEGGTLTGGNAGQPEPQVGQPGAVWQPWHLPGGPPLGILIPDGGYQETSTTLLTGQQLLAYTDGVTEAGALGGNQFQHGPLQRLLASLPAGLSGDQVIARLLQTLQSHVPIAWPEDDTTILCLERS
jgi:serine phosphatase RsbU (regulator of sigma subunit)